MRGYLIVAFVGALVTFLATFGIRRIATRIGAMSLPGPRSVHEYVTPTLGGAGMFLGFLAAIATATQIEQFDEMFSSSSEPLGLMLAAGVMFVVGALDDLREVSPPAKVAGQVLSASCLSLLGVTMLFFRVPFASYEYVVLSPNWAALVTVLTVVLLANALNLIDGLDGLAAGIVIISGIAFFLYSDRLFKAGLLDGSNIAPLVAAITVAICAGFLPHNWHPAKIFMGDAGAMFLGLLLAVSTITVGGRTADQFSGQTYFFFAPLLIPIVILAVPLADTGFSFLRRVMKRQSFSTPDREHLHHRLMRLGHGPRRTVAVLWLWTALLSAAALVPTYTNRGTALVPLAVAGLALLLFTYFHPGVRTRREEEAAAAEARAAELPAASSSGDEEVRVVDLEERRRARSG
ncbi:MAG: undecaprenyl/decaprenyl-phosphate alpha-N-acetylglucosaminyl 1-phosphate transferase [Actinobacteria bacterium]|nr:undecaprenyl/decaprenyl-phosphate alpha-N-acetylglucosaminyl 1-phosphate transferase [Actinomycetota bacterium]